MKKSKLLLVISLGLVLCLLCSSTATFSWFTRPRIQSGNSLNWSGSYDVSNGSNVTIKTYESTDDGETFSETPVTAFTNSAGLNAGARKYYRTDIINTGNIPQSVSLYLTSLTFPTTINGNFYLGVNSPLKTYKKYPPDNGSLKSSEKTKNDTMRVYFQPKSSSMSEPDGNWKGKNYYVAYGLDTTSDPSNYLAFTETPTGGTYYVDIPSNAKRLFISVQDWTESWQHTQYFTNLGDQYHPKVYYLNGNYTSDYDNAEAVQADVNGASIVNYYKTINVPLNDSFSAALTGGVDKDYMGKIEYYSGSTSIFDVDKNTGMITAKKEGKAVLYTKIISDSFGDSMQVETTVNVTPAVNDDKMFTDVPIVTNVKVASTSDEGEPGIESIYWYIKNDSDTNGLTYTIPSIYLTL